MRALLKLECRRAFTNRFFLLALIAGCAFAVIAAIQPIGLYLSDTVQRMLTDEYLAYKNMYQFAYTSAYVFWIPMRAMDSMPGLFVFTAPLFIALAYSWSYEADRVSGYAQSLAIRASRTKRYVAKAIAVFLAGGTVVAVPLIVNLVVLCCFIPLQLPNIYDKTYTGISFIAFASLFFTQPMLYVALKTALDFALGGLWATTVLALSLFMRNRIAIVATPYIALIVIKYVSESLYTLFVIRGSTLGYYSLTIIDHLSACGDTYTYSPGALYADLLVLLAVSVIVPFVVRRRDLL